MTAPPPTNAERLAAVCRVVWPKNLISTVRNNTRVCVHANGLNQYESKFYRPTSLDSLAQVVAALSAGQRLAFDSALVSAEGNPEDPSVRPQSPSETLTAPKEQLLAALEVAVGATMEKTNG